MNHRWSAIYVLDDTDQISTYQLDNGKFASRFKRQRQRCRKAARIAEALSKGYFLPRQSITSEPSLLYGQKLPQFTGRVPKEQVKKPPHQKSQPKTIQPEPAEIPQPQTNSTQTETPEGFELYGSPFEWEYTGGHSMTEES